MVQKLTTFESSKKWMVLNFDSKFVFKKLFNWLLCHIRNLYYYNFFSQKETFGFVHTALFYTV